MPRLFQDEGQVLSGFGGKVLVRCPECDGRATVSRDAWYAQLACEVGGHFVRKALGTTTCVACGYAAPAAGWTRRSTACPRCRKVGVLTTVRGAAGGEGADPYLGLPLLLQVPCHGQCLWAWNLAHLAYLEAFVAATLRERQRTSVGRDNQAMASRLPRWMKAAKHRDGVLAGLARLRSLAEAGSRRGGATAGDAPPSRQGRRVTSGGPGHE
jgi:hypothetical protein